MTCEARTGFYPGQWGEMPLFCNAAIGLRSWVDTGGRTHRACRHHVEALMRRYPRMTSDIAREDIFEEGRITVEWHGHAVDIDLAPDPDDETMDEDGPAWTNREGTPEFNGSFR